MVDIVKGDESEIRLAAQRFYQGGNGDREMVDGWMDGWIDGWVDGWIGDG